VHDPPVPAAGKPPVVEGAEYEVHGEDREGEVEAFFGFFDNECEEERADYTRRKNRPVINPALRGPHIKIIPGKDPVYCDRRPEDESVELEEHR